MAGFEAELRLALAIALNAWVLFCAHRFCARRVGGEWTGTLCDTLLLWFAVKYVSVGATGLLGMLAIAQVALIAGALGGAMLWMSRKSVTSIAGSSSDRAIIPVASTWLVIGFLVALAHFVRFLPVLSNDGLIYHLPAAVQWMQSGRIGLYDAWFINPANTYSPLAGSVFMCWWMLPVQCDALVRFAQMPAALLLFFAIVELCRSAGAKAPVAALVAAGAVLSRPFISQAIIVKDDLFLAAFFACTVAACDRRKLVDPLGPVRVALAIGLFASTKYTALLAAPLLLLLVDAPFRARWSWKRWTVAIGIAVAVAAPWYLRNLLLTGNPIYPIPVAALGWDGLYVAQRSTDMSSPAGFWKSVTGMYHSPPVAVIAILLIGWIVALLRNARSVLGNPITRTIIIGPVVGMALFAGFSHAPEIRYAFPPLVLLFACVSTIPSTPVALGVMLVCAGTGFVGLREIPQVPLAAIACSLIALLVARLPTHLRRAALPWATLVIAMALAGTIFVFWKRYLAECAGEATHFARQAEYGKPLADLWEFVDSSIPTDATVAYTGTSLVHPLFGGQYSRRLMYVPVRPNLRHYHELPSSMQPLTDQQLRTHFTTLLQQGADRERWLAAVRSSGARFIVIGLQDDLPTPPEREWVGNNPAFTPRFESSAGLVYEISPG